MLGAAIPSYPPPFFLPTPIKKERGNSSRIFAPSTLLCHLTFPEMRRLPDIAEGKIFSLPLLSSVIMFVDRNYFYHPCARGRTRYENAGLFFLSIPPDGTPIRPSICSLKKSGLQYSEHTPLRGPATVFSRADKHTSCFRPSAQAACFPQTVAKQGCPLRVADRRRRWWTHKSQASQGDEGNGGEKRY